MKKIISLLLLSLVIIVNAQVTQIQMPVGYGTDGTNRASLPLFQFGNFLYVKTAKMDSSAGYLEGKIFKVNMTTNEINELTSVAANPSYPEFYPLWWDYGMSQVRNVKEINGEIYFNGWQSAIYKINPSTNTLHHITNVSYDYEVLDNSLLPSLSSNGGSNATGLIIHSLNNLDQYYSYTVDTNGQQNYLELYDTFKVNNQVYYLCRYIGNGPLNNNLKLIRINSAVYPNLNFTILHEFNSDIGSLIGFNEIGYNGKPIVINNNIIWKRTYWDNTTSQYITTLASYNISNDTFNYNLFVPDSVSDFQYFTYNNNLYIKNSLNQFYVTNGSSTPVLSSMPNFYQYGSNFAFNTEYPFVGVGSKPIVEYNGNLFGKDLGLDTSYPKKIWKTNGTTLELISDQLELYSAKVHNGSLYAFGYNNVTSNYYYPKIVKFNNSANAFDEIWSFPDSGYFVFGSHLFFHNNYVFFTGNNGSSMPYSLYKLDLSSSLSTQENQKPTLKLYPNPTKSTLNFSEELSEIKIVDMSGKQVSATTSKTKTINVEKLPKGNYLLTAKNKNGKTVTEKFIKD